MKKMTLLSLGLLLSSFQPAVALTEMQVIAWTESIAAGSAAVAYLLANPFSCPAKLECPLVIANSRPQIKEGFGRPVCVGATTFAAANLLFGWILSKYTPHKRYEWAQKRLAHLEAKYLFNNLVTQENINQLLIDSGAQADALPLVNMFLDLNDSDRSLEYMIDQLNRGIEDEGYSNLSKKMSALCDTLRKHLLAIRTSEAIVKAQPQWLEQWKIYEHSKLEREKIAQQAMQTHVMWHV
jgi:hypothetical protein